VAASEASTGDPQLMRRFLEAAYARRNSNEWGAMSMESVCIDIGLNDRATCKKTMNLHRRIGNITEVTAGPRMDEPGWFALTPKGIGFVQQQHGR
jgi:hypothetical protein